MSQWLGRNLPEDPAKRVLYDQTAYIAVLLGIIAIDHSFLNLSVLILLLALGAFLLLGRPALLMAAAPFVLMSLSYNALRGFAKHIAFPVHGADIIALERSIFGFIPTLKLQHLLYVPGQLHWYDYLFAGLYMFHFIAPMIFAVWLWRNHRDSYWPFVSALLLLTYLGFFTYLTFPAMPPWLASQNHLLPPVHKILADVFANIGFIDFPDTYQSISANPVAAIPSIHAAYPMLFLLFVNRLLGFKKALIFSIYPLTLWFGIVYLGEHYVIDALLGIVYASLSYAVVTRDFWRHPIAGVVQGIRVRLGQT